MKNIQRNGIKFKVFEENELREKLGMDEKDINVVISYQDKFPELMMENGEGFVIDGEKLCNQLGVKDNFNTWLLGETRIDKNGNRKSQGKLIKYKCIENIDYSNDWNSPNAKYTQEEIKNMTPQKRSSLRIKNKILLTLECAKMIAMRQNNENGDLACKYFITIEKTLRNYESWNNIRNPEKEGNKEMNIHITNWCDRNGFDSSIRQFYQRENNLLNKCLTGLDAQEIRCNIGYRDINTREHLTIEINNALYNLQKLNISLLDVNMSFEERKRIIQITCDNQYSNLKMG